MKTSQQADYCKEIQTYFDDINKYKLDNIELIDANKFIDFINNNGKLEF